MIRMQVQLTDAQAAKLKRLAAQHGVSISALVREAVESIDDETKDEEKWRRALAVVGKYRSGSGLKDIARNHDKYLAEDVS